MSKQTLGQQFKEDLTNGAYRAGARKVSEVAKNALVTVCKKQKFTNSQIRAIVSLLDTENGHAAISFMLGVMLPQMPGIGKDRRVQRLCQEFRIEGMAIAGENLVDGAVKLVAPSISKILKGMPQAKEVEHEESSFLHELLPTPEAIKAHEIARAKEVLQANQVQKVVEVIPTESTEKI